jgi:hypothetical protein
MLGMMTTRTPIASMHGSIDADVVLSELINNLDYAYPTSIITGRFWGLEKTTMGSFGIRLS